MVDLIAYASRTGTRRNLDMMRAVNVAAEAEVWRILISRHGRWRTEGFRYCIDNGAWTDFQTGADFDADQFEVLIERLGAGADFIILPDIVAGGHRSLDMSTRWMNRCRSVTDLVLIPVQDGMEPADLKPLVGPNVGIFMGGSDAWKLREMRAWGEACAEWEIYYHVARVNTLQRFGAAHDSGAWSIDGSSISRYAKTMPLLERGRSRPSLLNPRKSAA